VVFTTFTRSAFEVDNQALYFPRVIFQASTCPNVQKVLESLMDIKFSVHLMTFASAMKSSRASEVQDIHS
jgi:hypothetical protein